MRHVEGGQARRRGRALVKLGIAVVAFGAVHFLILSATYTAASGWDDACRILYEDEFGTPRPSGGGRGPIWRFYSDPGFTCEYQLSGRAETLTLAKDLTGPRNLAIGTTGLLVVAAIYVARLRRDRSNARGSRPEVRPREKQT